MGIFFQRGDFLISKVIMKLFVFLFVAMAAFLFAQIEGQFHKCETDADCHSSQCCVSFKTGGPSFCRGLTAKGQKCDLQKLPLVPLRKRAEMLDDGSWPTPGLIGKC